jgi:hypothetical protein
VAVVRRSAVVTTPSGAADSIYSTVAILALVCNTIHTHF